MISKDLITIITFSGDVIFGFEISHQRDLPKSAKLIDCNYDEAFNNINRYATFGKANTKYFLLRTKF